MATMAARPDVVYQTNAENTGCAFSIWWFETDTKSLVDKLPADFFLSKIIGKFARHDFIGMDTLVGVEQHMSTLGFTAETKDETDMAASFVQRIALLNGPSMNNLVSGTLQVSVSFESAETEVDVEFYDDKFAVDPSAYTKRPITLADLYSARFLVQA